MNRKKLSIIVALAFCMTILNTVGAYATTTSDTNTSEEENTLNLSEIEALKSANQKEIEEIQNQLDDTKQKLEQSQNDTTLKEEYQQQLQDKMTLQQENIQYIETQLSQIQDDISTLNENIDYLESEMNSLELNIDTNMQQFKKRLKAMYVSGDDSIASILVGTTDFFEMLSKMEFISRISSHDNALMETLQSQIDDYNEDKEILTQSLKELEDKKQEATSKKSEFNETLSSLSSDYENTQSEIDRLSLEQEALNGNIEDLEQYQKEQEEEQKRQEEAEKEANNQATSENLRKILGEAVLVPTVTRDPAIDTKVQEVLAQVVKPDMDNYDKLLACYKWIINHAYYKYDGYTGSWNNTNVAYANLRDKQVVSFAKPIICGINGEQYGTCINYGAAMVVFARALGFDAYRVGGETIRSDNGYGEHYWCVIKINGIWYNFDPQNADNSWADPMRYFGKTNSEWLGIGYKFTHGSEKAEDYIKGGTYK